MENNKERWVPQNLSQLKKYTEEIACLYGLPLFKLYYSAPFNCNGTFNRIDGQNNLLHAFRIIVGMTWNWTVCNVTNFYAMSESRLNASIMAVALQCCCKKYGKLDDYDYDKIFEVDKNSKTYKMIFKIKKDLIKLAKRGTIQDAKAYFENNISKYAVQKEALTIHVPLKVQRKYKDMYKQNALEEFKAEHQEMLTAEMDLTTDIVDWAINFSETELRENCWLKPKTMQRLLNKIGKNTKRKHGRPKVQNSDQKLSA